jgi:hypothetical protein
VAVEGAAGTVVEVGTVDVGAVVVEVVVDEVDDGGLAVAMACSSAAMVAASTVPVGSTPNAVWNDFSASVKASVHFPSTGPSQ